MNTTAPLAKNRAIRLQQELVPILRATGSFEGAKQFWRRIDFAKGFGRKLACYGFDRVDHQALINRVAFPEVNATEVEAALAAGNKLTQLYQIACGHALIARDANDQYQHGRKGLKVLATKKKNPLNKDF
ncbi:MAG TPA: hypothetical protein VJ721_02900 [Chthoniobacterales bacterium]|nr:hypothetical protein [Chthoniobacterales bacterium]